MQIIVVRIDRLQFHTFGLLDGLGKALVHICELLLFLILYIRETSESFLVYLILTVVERLDAAVNVGHYLRLSHILHR